MNFARRPPPGQFRLVVREFEVLQIDPPAGGDHSDKPEFGARLVYASILPFDYPLDAEAVEESVRKASAMTDNMLLLEEFFAPAEMAALWAYAMTGRRTSSPARSSATEDQARHDTDFRRSRVLFDVADIYPLVSDRVLERAAPRARAGWT